MPPSFRRSCLALCLASAFAQAATDTWEGSGPDAAGTASWTINALAVSPDGQTVYAGSASGRVLRYLVSPKVASVAVPANASYKAGDNLVFTLTWSAAVSVSGSPQLGLTIGGASVQADYLDSPTTTTTRFRYTLLADQSDTDGIAIGTLSLNGGTIADSGGNAATLTLNNVGATGSVLVDGSAPTLAAANIVANNQADPHTIVLTFSEALANSSLGSAADWTLTANGGSPVYGIAGVALAGNQVTLTLKAVDLADATSFIANSAINGHLKVTPPATLTDSAGNPYAAGQITEAGATHTTDATAPTLSAVGGGTATGDGGTLDATANEKARGYWIAVASGATAPAAAEVKAAATYGGVTVAAHGSGVLPSGTAGTLTISGLAASSPYDLYLVAEDAAGNLSTVSGPTALTTTAAPVVGACGSANGAPASSAPTAGLCANGAVSAIAGSGPWNWTCAGSNGGGTATCAAPLYVAPTPGSTPDPTPQPITGGQIAVLSGGTVTVAGPAQITANGGSTVTLSGNAVIGATIALPASTGGQPVTINIGGQSFSIANSGGAASFTVATIRAADGSTQTVLVLSPPADGGTPAISIAGSAPAGQVLVAIALPGGGGRVLEVVSSGGEAGVTIGVTPGGTLGVAGGYNISLTRGKVSLPITRRSTPHSAAPRATQDAVDIHAGERAYFDDEGYFVSLQLGTAAGDGAGDALTLDLPANLRLAVAVPRLDATVARLGKTLQQAVAKAVGGTLVAGQTQGALALDFQGQGLWVLPLGTVEIDPARADGVELGADGTAMVTAGGVKVRFAPLAGSLAGLAQDLAAALSLQAGGVLIAKHGEAIYVLRPDWFPTLEQERADGFAAGVAGGVSYARNFSVYALHPAFADFAALVAAVAQALPGATVTTNPDGTVTLIAGDRRWTLVPAATLEAAPPGDAAWWTESDGSLRLRYPDGSMQRVGVE